MPIVGCAHPRPASTARVTERIRHYERQVEKYPRHYPAYVSLGYACLDRARQTHDAAWVRKARAYVARSLEIQPSLTGYQAMAAICNFAHRFPEAIVWGEQAAQAAPEDTSVTALLVEAHLALGQIEEATRLCQRTAAGAEDFHGLVAKARLAAAQERPAEAAELFVRAAAASGEAREFATWALVMAAGVWIDAGRTAEARLLLDDAARLDDADFMLALHRAELAEAEGDWPEALARYERLAAEDGDPTVHARAFIAARRLGNESAGHRHFTAAELAYRKVLAEGEVYTLGSLADLYAEAGVKLPEALALAEQNLSFVRDRRSRDLVERLGVKND